MIGTKEDGKHLVIAKIMSNVYLGVITETILSVIIITYLIVKSSLKREKILDEKITKNEKYNRAKRG